jgi:cellobiose phosphorylase
MRGRPAPADLARRSDPAPHACLLANGRYGVVATGAGTGRSTWDGFALTRFRGDRVEDPDGLFLYLGGARFAPTRAEARPGVLVLAGEHDGVTVRVAHGVAPSCDAELRRIALRETAGRARSLAVTTACELALDRPGAAAAHPAFSKLFVQTDWDAASGRLVARRRPRAPGERVAWLGQVLVGPGALEVETDRAELLGRGGSLVRPAALTRPLTGRVGNVLDPAFAMRRTVALAPGGTAELLLVLAAGGDRTAVVTALDAAASRGAPDALFAAAEAHARDRLAHLGLDADDGAYLDDLAGALLYGHPGVRAPAAATHARRGGAPLDGLGGERPLVVAPLAGDGELGFARALLVACRYWHAQGVDVDVLLLAGGGQREAAHALAAAASATPGARVVVWCRDEEPAERIDAALARASGVFAGAWPDLAGAAPAATAARFLAAREPGEAPPASEALGCDNGFGGFRDGGREYAIRIGADGRRPPMPWVNCLANPAFGALVSESGAGTTWSGNSREHRLTPWSNDPVSDPHGESLHLRDEEAGVFWSPTPGPSPDGAPYEVVHGFGYTNWSHFSRGLEQAVTTFVPPADPLRVTRVALRNTGDRPRRVSLFAYARLVLGEDAEAGARGVVTEHDAAAQLLLARSAIAADGRDAVAFAAPVAPAGAVCAASGDRAAFLGRGGTPAAPRAIACDDALDGRVGAGLDPCFAWQVTLEIGSGETVACAFLLGAATSAAAARALVARHREAGVLARAEDATRAFWRGLVAGVAVETPVPALDWMLNGWLGVQTAACRLWGRTAFYQSGGAFGFRDQLQDAAALVHLDPSLTRRQILLHAAHQLPEGDVLHWWHPPASRGTRTRFSDDLLWLPHLAAFYVRTTGDAGVLDERVGFRTARPLAPGEDEAYLETAPAAETATVYEHACRALDRSLTRGAHGLPLMGTGDWNDGMNRVGREGRGESVWLGFFLYATLPEWIAFAEARGERERAARYRAYRERLHEALDAAWDGAWYRRAYYDDGTPLGSAGGDECRIDALAQAWAVISGAAPRARAVACMDAVARELVSADDGIVRLLAPPFDRTPHEPGYIKGYLPGIRENGGQYTHAACWVVQALEAMLGRRDRAVALLERISPVWHGTRERIPVYRVEPYVVAADVYGAPPHVGRGGWTWYTGSSGWMLRVALEWVLGVTLVGGDTLRIRPCVPDDWPRFAVRLRLPDGRTHAAIEVVNPHGRSAAVVAFRVDGAPGRIEDGAAHVRLPLDGARHERHGLGSDPGGEAAFIGGIRADEAGGDESRDEGAAGRS